MPLTNGDQQDQQGDVEFFDAEEAESFSAPSPPPRHDSITTNFLLQLNSTHRRNSTTTSSKNDKSSSSSLNDLRHRLRPHWNSKNKTCTTKKKTANSPQQRKNLLYNDEFSSQRHTHFLKVVTTSHSSEHHEFNLHQLPQHRRPPP